MMGDRVLRLIAYQQTMRDLANELSSNLSRPVTDATALKAKFDFTITYSLEGVDDPGVVNPSPRGPVNLLVIDRIEKTPTEN